MIMIILKMSDVIFKIMLNMKVKEIRTKLCN